MYEVYSEDRPWGRFEKFHQNQSSTVKLIYINPNSRLSLQYHKKRREFWRIIKGSPEVEINGIKRILNEGDSIWIPTEAQHRVKANDELCILLEISYGEFDEEDIVRIQDDYDRI